MKRRIWRLDFRDSTENAPSVCVLLVDNTVGRMRRASLVFALVDFLVLLAAGSAACFFCTRVFRDGASAVAARRIAALHFLRFFAVLADVGASARPAAGFSSLGDACVETLRASCVIFPMELVCLQFWSRGVLCTHDFYFPCSKVALFVDFPRSCAATAGSFLAASSVSWRSCCISSVPFLDPIPLIALAHSAIASMTLSA